MNKNNIIWINWLKCICIVFVYLNHSEIYSGVHLCIRPIYRPFFVNAFFFVSGYLLFKKQLSQRSLIIDKWLWIKNEGCQFLKSILFKLIIPTIIFSAAMFAPKVLLRGSEITLNNFIHDTIMGGSIWFTSALAVAELLIFIPLSMHIKNIWIYVLFGILLCSCSSFLYSNHIYINGDPTLPWYYKSGMSATILMSLGGAYWKYEEQMDRFFSKWKLYSFIGIVTIAFYAMYKYSSQINVSINLGPINIISISIISIAIYFLVRICKLLPQSNFVNYWGRNTIGLYLFCGAIPNTVASLLLRMNLSSLLIMILALITSIVIALLSVYAINKYMPYMYDLRLLLNRESVKS